VLYFNDIRRFGYLKIATTEELKNLKTKELGKLGVEPLGEELTLEYLEKMAKRFPNRKIKQFIMDQTIIAGIGNIYADEALFDANIKPMRLAKDIKGIEWSIIIMSIQKVLNKGIKYGGSSSENFVDAFGEQGRAHEHLKVYRKTGQKCPNNCGGAIERIVIGSRSTHWCRKCQR
jgi:formamidopyrimidine-DNA glycosylase